MYLACVSFSLHQRRSLACVVLGLFLGVPVPVTIEPKETANKFKQMQAHAKCNHELAGNIWKHWPVVLLFLERVWIERSPHWRFWACFRAIAIWLIQGQIWCSFGFRHVRLVRLLCSFEALTAVPMSPPVQPQFSDVAVGLVSLEHRNVNFPNWTRSNQ